MIGGAARAFVAKPMKTFTSKMSGTKLIFVGLLVITLILLIQSLIVQYVYNRLMPVFLSTLYQKPYESTYVRKLRFEEALLFVVFLNLLLR